MMKPTGGASWAFGFGGAGGFGGLAEALACVAVTAVVLHLELHRRAGSGPSFGGSSGHYAEGCKRLLRQCAPEAIGLLACLALAAALRALREEGKPQDDEAWARIKAEWPMLMTADSLLSLQAMLRVVVLLSAALRRGAGGPAPLADEAAALWFFGGLARVLVLGFSNVYMLDGPLGGSLPVACEVAVLPLLLILGHGTFRRAKLACVSTVLATAVFAYRNRLCLANEPAADALFVLAHCFDILAAFAYILRTLLIDNGTSGSKVHISVGFAHLLLPIQQALPAYYFLQAFDEVPELVGAGLPFQLLQLGNAAQLGMYLGATALFVAERFAGGGPGAGASAPGPAGGTVAL